MRFLMAIIALFVISTSALAQKPFNTDGQAIETRKIIAVLGRTANIVGLEQMPASVMFNGDFDYSDWRRAINYVLANSSSSDWEAVDADGKIVIRKKQTMTAASDRRDAETAGPVPPGCPAHGSTNRSATPGSQDPRLRAEYWRTVGYECLRRQQADAEMELAFQQQVARDAHGYLGDGRIHAPGMTHDGRRFDLYGRYDGPGHYGAGFYPWLKGCSDGRPAAYLEFEYKGRRDEKHLWLVSINGVGPGTVDQADTWSQKLPVCSDAAVVVSVEKIGLPWKWERQYSLRPFTSTEVPVGEFLGTDKPRLVR